MAIEIAGYGLEEPLPLIGISLWNIILFIAVLIIGIIVVRIATGALKKWMIKGKIAEILAEFITRVIRLILFVFVFGTALAFLGIEIGAGGPAAGLVAGHRGLVHAVIPAHGPVQQVGGPEQGHL